MQFWLLIFMCSVLCQVTLSSITNRRDIHWGISPQLRQERLRRNIAYNRNSTNGFYQGYNQPGYPTGNFATYNRNNSFIGSNQPYGPKINNGFNPYLVNNTRGSDLNRFGDQFNGSRPGDFTYQRGGGNVIPFGVQENNRWSNQGYNATNRYNRGFIGGPGGRRYINYSPPISTEQRRSWRNSGLRGDFDEGNNSSSVGASNYQQNTGGFNQNSDIRFPRGLERVQLGRN